MYALLPRPGQPDCPAGESQVSTILSTGCCTTRETGLQRTCWTAPGLTCSSLQLSALSHQPQRAQKIPLLQAREGKALQTARTNPSHRRTLQLVGPGCVKVSSTTSIRSVWDYSPRSPSGPGKQCQASQLIAQLHPLPTLSRINSHHAPNLFPLSPPQQQQPEGERSISRACRSIRGLAGPRCRGLRLIPHAKTPGVIFKPNTSPFAYREGGRVFISFLCNRTRPRILTDEGGGGSIRTGL